MLNSILGERIIALACSLFAGYMAVKGASFPAGGNRFPLFSCAVLILISVIMLLRTFMAPRTQRKELHFQVNSEHLRPLIITVMIVAYVLLMKRVGFYTLSVLFFCTTTFAVGVRNYVLIIMTACIVFPLMYLFFETVLHTGMPHGILF